MSEDMLTYNLAKNVLRCIAAAQPYLILRIFKNILPDSLDLVSFSLFLDGS